MRTPQTVFPITPSKMLYVIFGFLAVALSIYTLWWAYYGTPSALSVVRAMLAALCYGSLAVVRVWVKQGKIP